ncbi:hypothetical protein TRICI_004624 [Trichomonascus ciferrii]|uniref:F-box domain-containing protein n=1 Tax=Trichomonascus ciferrii TaxID=44093 RepID=A0A642V0C0_9ASCO|nr:hypothetical protein TRICI_004624 [Trichomonascus ciferrii]
MKQIPVAEPDAGCFRYIRGKCYELPEEPVKPFGTVDLSRIPTFSGKSDEFYDWASWVNGYIAGYKEYFGRDEFREIVISKLPRRYQAYFAARGEPVLDYFDVFEILEGVVLPESPSAEVEQNMGLASINLLDRQLLNLFMQHHLIYCLVNGMSEDDSKFHLLDQLFYPVGEVIDAAFYEFNYEEAVALAKHLTYLVAAKAQKYLKSDPSVNLTKVYEDTADDIFGRLCDVWAAERDHKVENMKFEIGPGESLFDDEKLYETMLHYGTAKASDKTRKLMRQAIKQQRIELSDTDTDEELNESDAIPDEEEKRVVENGKQGAQLMDLPTEILEIIADYLRVDWLMNLQECNKRLHSIIGHNVWRQLSISDSTENLLYSGFTPTCSDENIVHPYCCQRRCIRLDNETTPEFYEELLTSGIQRKMDMQLQSVERLTIKMMNIFRAFGHRYLAYVDEGAIAEEDADYYMEMLNDFKSLLPTYCPNVKELNICEFLEPYDDHILEFDSALVDGFRNAIVNVEYKQGRTLSHQRDIAKLFRRVFQFPNLRKVCLLLHAEHYEEVLFNMQLPEGVTTLSVLCEMDVRISESKLKQFLAKNTTLESLNLGPGFQIQPCTLSWLPQTVKRFTFNNIECPRRQVQLPNLDSLYFRIVKPAFGFFSTVKMENLRTLNISYPFFDIFRQSSSLDQPFIFASCPNLYELICNTETLPFFMREKAASIKSLVLVDYVRKIGSDEANVSPKELLAALERLPNINTIMLEVSSLIDPEGFDHWKHTKCMVLGCRKLERLIYNTPVHIDSATVSDVHYFEYRTKTNMYCLHEEAKSVNIPKVRRILAI